jgi:hypothetical protein
VLPAIRLRDPIELFKDAGQLRLWDLAAVAADKEDPFSFWSYLQTDGSLRGGVLDSVVQQLAQDAAQSLGICLKGGDPLF